MASAGPPELCQPGMQCAKETALLSNFSQKLDAMSRSRIRSLGHIRLCGVLHVCWQTRDSVTGSYMICLLYRCHLCIATAGRADSMYAIQACIPLNNIKVEEPDNGRGMYSEYDAFPAPGLCRKTIRLTHAKGLQCHTARYSWKLVFESDHQLYELIMSACSQKEMMHWRTRLDNSTPVNGQHQSQTCPIGSLALDIKSLGFVYRKPGSLTLIQLSLRLSNHLQER